VEGLEASVLDPARASLGISQEVEQHDLVIAPQGDDFRRKLIAHKTLQDSGRVGPKIDVVTDGNRHGLMNWIPSDICRDQIGDLGQQIRPAMDVANGVDSLAFGCPKGRRRLS